MSATGLLQVAFIVLKILDIINWSWFWVLCPSWITILIVVFLFVLKIFVAD